jgi:hypothetical protein
MGSKRNRGRLIRLGVASFLTLAATMFLLSRGTTKTHAQEGSQGHTPVHMTTDWSNRHMVYSAPSSFADAWRLQAEPRYLHQWTRRNLAASQAQSAR